MTIPGLTCHACESPLAPRLATRTDHGWKHAGRCSCAVTDCNRIFHAGGYCNAHYARFKRWGDPLHGVVKELHIEDAEWLAETGETFTRAAERLGFNPDALEKALDRAGRTDLTRRMRSRESRVA